MKRIQKAGFTLIEIMIVVAIIALLAAIAIPNVLRGRTTANESAVIGNLRALVSSLEMFRSVNNTYPLTANWVANMYTTPDPDFGPPSFNHVMDATACPSGAASSCVQGYRYDYVSGAGTAYTVRAVPDSASTGTRAFRADETGVIVHCSPGTNATTLALLVAELTIDQTPNLCNGSAAT